MKVSRGILEKFLDEKYGGSIEKHYSGEWVLPSLENPSKKKLYVNVDSGKAIDFIGKGFDFIEIEQDNCMEEKFYLVYRHKNIVTGKSYIGMTSRHIKVRIGYNGNGYLKKRHAKFSNAIRKYGWESFETTILESNICESEIDSREIYWINHYNSYSDGYNSTTGGKQGKGHIAWNKGIKNPYSKSTIDSIRQSLLGFKHTKETNENRIKTRKQNHKIWHSEETKKKIGIANKGKQSWIKGGNHSDETILKIRKSQKNARRIVQKSLTDDSIIAVFDSLSEAAFAMCGNRKNCGHICSCARGKRNHAFGYRWFYES